LRQLENKRWQLQ